MLLQPFEINGFIVPVKFSWLSFQKQNEGKVFCFGKITKMEGKYNLLFSLIVVDGGLFGIIFASFYK